MIDQGVYRKDGAAYAVSSGYYSLGIVYNTREVKQPPASWKDLWRPEYAGAVALPSPANSSGVPFVFFLARVWSVDPSNLAPLYAKLATLDTALYFDSSGAATNAYQSGEAVIGAHFNVGAWDLIDKGLPIGFAVPKEGAWATDARLHLVRARRTRPPRSASSTPRSRRRPRPAWRSGSTWGRPSEHPGAARRGAQAALGRRRLGAEPEPVRLEPDQQPPRRSHRGLEPPGRPQALNAGTAMSALLSIEGVSTRFGAYQALDRIDLAINQGEFVALLGPSGCGKTTLLRSIAGFLTPDAGRILIEGRDVSRLPPHHRPLNTVFQNYALFPHMSVLDNVARPAPSGRVAGRSRRARAGGAGHGGPGRVRPALPARDVRRTAAAWRWRAPSSTGPNCCCWTSRCRRWT